MSIEWESRYGLATDADIDEVERRFQIEFSPEHRAFLKTITNGGCPIGMAPIPTTECDGGAADLLGVYGINSPTEYCDMAGALDHYRGFLPDLIPFGYEALNGKLYVDTVEIPGRLVYIHWDELDLTQTHPRTYHVSMSISEFLAVSSKMAEEFVDED